MYLVRPPLLTADLKPTLPVSNSIQLHLFALSFKPNDRRPTMHLSIPSWHPDKSLVFSSPLSGTEMLTMYGSPKACGPSRCPTNSSSLAVTNGPNSVPCVQGRADDLIANKSILTVLQALGKFFVVALSVYHLSFDSQWHSIPHYQIFQQQYICEFLKECY